MKKTDYFFISLISMGLGMSFTACSDDNVEDAKDAASQPEAAVVGQAVGNFDASEWFPGGELGTTENISATSYEDPTKSVTGDMDADFRRGELIFERQFSESTAPFKGLGPASVRRSCLDCHPNYGHGKRFDRYTTSYGNGMGYLLAVYHPTAPGSNDGSFIAEVTGMPQTQAHGPFKNFAPIDESKVNLQWKQLDKMESGIAPSVGNGYFTFPDGEKFYMQYPVVEIPQSAFNTDPVPSNYEVRIESTIGIPGTGLIDAIPEEDIIAQYKSEAEGFKKRGQNVSEYLNPSMFNAETMDMAPGAWYGTFTSKGSLADGSQPKSRHFIKGGQTVNGPAVLKRYTYALTRGTLQDGPGANAVWNITNVSRPDRPNLYTTDAWALKMSETPEVIDAVLKQGKSSPYYADGTREGIANAIKILLSPKTDQFENNIHPFTPDMTNEDYYAFMVWHRGLAIPRARDLNDPKVQRGKELFTQMGCVSCHRPSWKTGSDNYWQSDNLNGKKLPTYPNQTIYPYSDFVQHKLYMKNDLHGSWCRTTPLWGRGLSEINTGAEDRLHDCRARNEVEAIMWHAYSKNSHAYFAASKFYNLSKADRDAVVAFLRAI